jgi:hypothetical protein
MIQFGEDWCRDDAGLVSLCVDSDAIFCYCLNNIFEIARAMFRYALFTPVGSESTPDMIERWLDDVRAPLGSISD